MDAIAFKTRARTIDHLGREQIADCPTAISELWKNAYDAYARNVELNIFQGEIPIATIHDDGHGMDRTGFEERWLVIGTESKINSTALQEEDRNGIPPRPKQGQKGIGRLSSAYLGPLLLFISKRRGQDFVASLIDWRLFENPFLLLNDIQLPVVEFKEKSALLRELPRLFDTLMGNIWGESRDKERKERLALAWARFDEHEAAENRPSTRSAIEHTLIEATFHEGHLLNWPVWDGSSECGTAMVIAHIAFDLEAQLELHRPGIKNDVVKVAQDKLLQTLVSFTDPFLRVDERVHGSDFSYSATAWDGGLPRNIISSERTFTYESLERLEHVLEGAVSSDGTFQGRIKAFGTWVEGAIVIPPIISPPARADSKVGPFHLRIGTFEQVLTKSIHEEAEHAQLMEQAERYGGFMVFRDDLRVLPYGRADNDFFEIERRRSQHAGREFWSNRRMFGRVALSRSENPNLRDKAGREGIIDNRASKAFRDLVTNILRTAALRYFGTEADQRQERIKENEATHKRRRAEEAQAKIRSRRRREFKSNLERTLPLVQDIFARLNALSDQARAEQLPSTEAGLIALRQTLADLKSARSELAIGPPPKSLGPLEKKYDEYRRAQAGSAELLTRLTDATTVRIDQLRLASKSATILSEQSRNAAHIHNRLRKWNLAIREIYRAEQNRLEELVDQKNKEYHAETRSIVSAVEDEALALGAGLVKLEDIRDRIDTENELLFEAYLSTLRSLQDSVDIEVLLNTTIDDLEEMRSELTRLNSLAQLGITVEIVGHEIDGLEEAVSRGLRALPADVQKTETYRRLTSAHRSLVDKLRFLSPLKLSGERDKRWISGDHIYRYLIDFLSSSLSSGDVNFEASQSFLNYKIYDHEARILPVFINIVNNAIYWTGQTGEQVRQVKLDVIENAVVIADNGPGVAAEDIKHLFSLFFTRKLRGGRGVGLYLSRANLATSGHKISYVTEESNKTLVGANFRIEFKGARND